MSLFKLQLMVMGLEFLHQEGAKVKLLDVTWLPITKSWLMLLLWMFIEGNSRYFLGFYLSWWQGFFYGLKFLC
jgi:hypothetical protein